MKHVFLKKINVFDLPIVIPSGFNFGHAVVTMWIISLSSSGVSESTTGNGINPYEKDKNDNVKNRDVVPVPSNVFQHTGHARLAIVAKQSGGVVPTVAIRILRYCNTFLVVTARCWWFATPGLHY